jgi:HEAT repeat protein
MPFSSGGFMSAHVRHRWIQFAVLAAGVAAAPARLAAQQTRPVPVESLIYDLNNPDPVRRQAAAHELGVARYRAATAKLVTLAHDPVPTVRREVELSLERMEDPQSLPGFIAFATDSENDIRSRAVTALVKLHLPRTNLVDAALAKVGDLIFVGSDDDLELVVEPDVPVSEEVVATLRGRVIDPQRGIRRTAIRGLGILRAAPAVPDLLQVVREDRDDGLRFEGVRALRKIGDASVAPHFVALLNVNSDTVRNELIATLGAMRDRGAVSELTRIVEQAARTDKPRILALSALADIADPSSLPLFDRLKGDENEMMRLYANEGIARTADSNVKTAVSAARLVEKSERVRVAQAFALLRFGQSEFLDELIRDLEHFTTRSLAKEYLQETQPADRAALFAQRQASATAREHLADVYGRMGDPGALPTLQAMARDPDADVAKAAQRALRRLSTATSSQ